MPNSRRALRSAAASLCCAVVLPAFAGSPQLNNLLPIAGQRGENVDVTFYGARLDDATDILFHTDGIVAGELSYENNRVRTVLTIAPDAPIGEHQVRVVTASGVSEMMTFRVLDRPIIKEQQDEPLKNNNQRFRQIATFDEPQVVPMGSTVIARTIDEDIDYYAVDLKKGQRLAVQVDGMSAGRGFTDSYLAVLDDKRFEIASSDDTPLLKQDPYVSLIAPKDGRYVIVVRDSGYGGDNNNWYMLHVGSFPRPAAVFPLGGQPGEQVTLRFIGGVSGDFEQRVKLPDQPNEAFQVVPVRDGQAAPSGHTFRVNQLPNVIEDPAADNDNLKAIKDGEAIAVPTAYNGIIDKPGDMDCFKVRLDKNQQIRINCFADAMGSPLDSVVNIFRVDDGKHLLGNDDQRTGTDSVIEFKAPDAGEYYIRVRDHRKRGGDDYVYRIEVTSRTPAISTRIDRYDNNRPQLRQAIAVPRGNRHAALVRVSRDNVGGDLMPMIEGLPAGLAFAGMSPAEQGDMMPVVFSASADAPMGAGLVDIKAQGAVSGDSAEQVAGGLWQVVPTVLGNPNRTEYAFSTLREMPVAVTQAVPIKIDVVPPKAPLVRDGKMQLKLTLTRGDYEGRVRAYLLWRPPGMGGAGLVELHKDKTEAVYEIDANGGAPCRDWPMAVHGYADLPGGPVWVSSELFNITIQEPFVTGKIAKAKCMQGESVQIEVELEHPREWKGQGTLKLLGLPAGCETQELQIKPGQAKAVFNVKVADKAPAGQHKSLMAEMTITINGEPVIHRLGRGGQLRIDKPRAKRDAQARAGEQE